MIDRESVDRWLEAYVDAWKSYDRDSIAALFSEECRYSYRPHGDTIEGRDAIVRSWLEDEPDEPGTYDGSYRAVAVDGDTAVAVGQSTYTSPERVYDNCYVMRFDDDGRCREFTEWFMERKGAEG
jgi:hypothetical protein